MKQGIYTFTLIISFLVIGLTVKAQEFRYSVEGGGKTVVFSECFVPELKLLAPIVQKTSVPLKPSQPSAAEKVISLKHGTCKGDNELLKWFCTAGHQTAEKRELTIKLLNGKSEAVKVWRIMNAALLKFEGPTLTAKGDSGDVAIESLELTYEKIEPE